MVLLRCPLTNAFSAPASLHGIGMIPGGDEPHWYDDGWNLLAVLVLLIAFVASLFGGAHVARQHQDAILDDVTRMVNALI